MHCPTDLERQQIARTVFGDGHADRWDDPATQAYFNHYISLICPASLHSGDAVIEIGDSTLESHATVLNCIRILREDPLLSFDEFVTKIPGLDRITVGIKEQIASLIVQVAFMITSSDGGYQPHRPESDDTRCTKWEQHIDFATFVESAFNKPSDTTPEQRREIKMAVKNKKSLKAWKLMKRYNIIIQATENLLEHLLYDPDTKVLKIFHQMFFLRTQLEATEDEQLDIGFRDSLKLGALPPKLLLETLLTFYEILFPIASVGDKKSHSALKRMIESQNFDESVKLVSFVRNVPSGMTYEYWGDRLTKLHDAIKRPPPKNPIVSWFERHTSERNALTVAIIGLFLAALFGLLSFIVGLLQLILAWVAWRYPNS